MCIIRSPQMQDLNETLKDNPFLDPFILPTDNIS